jgi:hypothetical protein
MKTFVWVLIYLGVTYLGLNAMAYFKFRADGTSMIALGALAGIVTNLILKRIRREP